MKANKISQSLFSLLLVLAILVSCVGTAFAANEAEETEAAVTVESAQPVTRAVTTKSGTTETIVADWVHDYTIVDRGADNLMADYAKLGITDVYLLVKGTAGKIGWTSSVANTVQASNGDILKAACEAGKKYGVRVHAWLMAGHDDHYINNIDSSAMAYHFRVGYGSSVNQRLNLRDPGYRDYTAKLVKELVTNYDIAGIHLDCIRYFELYYDWGKNARDELLTNYGITIDQYNAATKAMCKRAGYSYTMKTASTAGYNNGASYSYVAYSDSGTSASGNTTFSTVLTSSSYGDAYKGAQAFMEMRTDTVKGFVETVKKAAGDDIIISCALMPEPIENTFSKCLYGQDAKKLGEVCDYIVPMAYATQYQQTSSWPASLSEKCAAQGANVVTGIQAFNETYVSYASDLNAEIPQVLAKAETVNAKSGYGDIVGYAFFRGGAMTIGNATYDQKNSTLDVYISNQTTTSDTKYVLKLQNGMTVNTSALTNGFSNKTGFKSGASFTVSSDKKTITISNSGSAVLGGTSHASFTVAVSGTPSTTYGALQLTSYYGSSYSEGKSFCVTSDVSAGVYNGITKGTCSDAHTAIETWTDGNGKHFAFCYNCLTDLTETCVIETVESEGYTTTECVGGLNSSTGKTDVDAFSLTGGCGYSCVVSDSLCINFNPGDICDDTADWIPSAAGSMTGTVDTTRGVLYGDITGGDPYIMTDMTKSDVYYGISADDIIEIRMKTTLTNGTGKGAQIFFRTTGHDYFNEEYSINNAILEHATGNYEVIRFSFNEARPYIGETMTMLRLDPLGVPGASTTTASYELDYIYIGPASNAPSMKNNSELYFDFDNSADAMSRYSGSIYGARNFDRAEEGYWATNGNGNASNYSIDNEAGTLNLSVGSDPDSNGDYNLWLETTSKHGSYPWAGEEYYTYYPLNYDPEEAGYVQVRFKLNGCQEVGAENALVYVVYDYLKDNTYGATGDMYAEVDMDAEGYQTVKIPVSETFKNADTIKSLALRFKNIKSTSDGTITIDYIYVGVKDSLYFGFENDEEAQKRYTSKTYGNNNFDNGNWVGRTTSVTGLTYNNEQGEISFSSSDATQNYHYIQTSSNTHTNDTPLKYVPSAGDSMQIRFKIEDAQVSGSPAITIHYMTDERTQIANSAVTTRVLNESYLDGDYHFVNLPMDASFTSASFISALRVGFTGISSAEGKTAKFTIDYIFVGDTANMPNQNKLFFDFTADAQAAERYATATYGNTDFDTVDNWLANNFATKSIENGELKGNLVGSPYIRTAIGGSTVNEKCPLNYKPDANDVLQVRFKATDTTATTVNIKLYYFITELSTWASITPTKYDIGTDYIVATIPLAGTSFVSAGQIQGIQVAFSGLDDGNLFVDYVYVGPEGELPIKDTLFFDFTNTSADTQRYSAKNYGGLNYDDAENLHWKTLTTNQVAANTSIDNTTAMLTATSASDGITSLYVDTTMNLIYELKNAEVFQTRLKMENFSLIDGKQPYVNMHFFDASGVIAHSETVYLTADQLDSDEFITLTVDVSDEDRAAGTTNKLRLYFGNVAGDKTSKITIDHLYVGSVKELPLQDSLYFGFTNTEEDQHRYNSKTYGNLNFDIGYWMYNTTRNNAPTYNATEGVVQIKVIGVSPYVQTVSATNSLGSAPLTFNPGEDTDLIQIRMKLENMEPIVEGTNGQIIVHFMTEAGSEVSTTPSLRFAVTEADLSGEYFIANMNAADFMAATSTIYAMRVTASALQAIEGKDAYMTIDYIYVGSSKTAPSGEVFFVDFVGNDRETIVYHSIVAADGTAAYNGALPEKESDETNHYTFASWQDADGNDIDPTKYNFTASATLYPRFTAEKHTISFTTVTDDSGETVKLHICSGCDYTVLTDHTWDKGEVLIAATCTEDGLTRHTCTLCGEQKEEVVDALGHDPMIDAAVAATCTEAGKTEGSHCVACGEILLAQTNIPALGHSYDNGKITTEATCTQDGVLTYTCANCGDTKTEVIKSEGHTPVTDAAVAATCTEAGKTEGSHCSTCDAILVAQTVIPASGHSYDDGVATTPATCTEDGVLTYTCANCGDAKTEVITATGHKISFVNEKPATCAENGLLSHYSCEYCKTTYVDAEGKYPVPEYYLTIAKTDHSYDDGVVTTKATCTAEGVLTYTCTVCSATKTETIAMTDHKLNYREAKAATCDKNGYIAHYVCTGCGKCYTDEAATNNITYAALIVKATGHKLNYRAAKAATCDKNGYIAHYVCTNCGKCYTDEAATNNVVYADLIVKATGHSYVYTDNGDNHIISCENCTYSATEAHTFVDGECVCTATENNEPKYLYDKNLTFSMNISAGADMKVIYTIYQKNVASYTDFYLVVNKEAADGEGVSVTYGFAEDMQDFATTIVPTTGAAYMHRATFAGIYAREMGDVFEATLYAVGADGNIYYGDTNASSMKSYLIGKIDAASSADALKTMCVDMLNYGAAAQLHFGYNTDNLVNADLSDEQKAYATVAMPEAVNSSATSGSGVNLRTSVSVKDKVYLNLTATYTPTDASALKAVICDAKGNVIAELPVTVKNNVLCQASYGEVGAKQMRQLLTATLYEGDKAVSTTVTWSVESYVAATRVNANATATQIAMVNAMLVYGDAVAAYMTASGQ